MSLERIVCINQFFRPKDVRFKSETHGDCVICQYDPINNAICSGYYPVKERIIFVVIEDNYANQEKEI